MLGNQRGSRRGRPLSLVVCGQRDIFQSKWWKCILNLQLNLPCVHEMEANPNITLCWKGALLGCVGGGNVFLHCASFFHSAGTSGVYKMHPYQKYSLKIVSIIQHGWFCDILAVWVWLRNLPFWEREADKKTVSKFLYSFCDYRGWCCSSRSTLSCHQP